jgi:hypothetical protein
MKRHLAWIAAALVVLAAVGAGFGAWGLVREQGSPLPQISAYSRGTTARVDPYLYCNVVNLDDCVKGGVQGELSVNARYPVQLSVPAAISQAPWRLLAATLPASPLQPAMPKSTAPCPPMPILPPVLMQPPPTLYLIPPELRSP